MPTYTFEDEQGKRWDIYMSMSEAPSWGEWAEFDGRRMKRIVETPVEPLVPDFTCEIRSQPRWDKTYPRCDKNGVGIILSTKEHREYKAKNPHLVWD